MRNRAKQRDCPSRKTMLKAHQERIPQTSPTSRIHLHDHCHISSQENTDWPTPPPPPEIQVSLPWNTTKCAAMPNTTLSEHLRPIHHQSFQSTVLILEYCAKTLPCAFHLTKDSTYYLVLLYGTFSCVLILLVRDLHVHVLCFSPFLVLHVFMFYLFNLFPYFVTIFSYLFIWCICYLCIFPLFYFYYNVLPSTFNG